MELYAIRGGLEALGTEEPYEVLIKTDSVVAIRYLTGLKGEGKQHLLAIADDIRQLVRDRGHKVSLQKAKKGEVARAHALAQMEMEKRREAIESKPVPLKL
jgi:ribonuclease HI